MMTFAYRSSFYLVYGYKAQNSGDCKSSNLFEMRRSTLTHILRFQIKLHNVSNFSGENWRGETADPDHPELAPVSLLLTTQQRFLHHQQQSAHLRRRSIVLHHRRTARRPVRWLRGRLCVLRRRPKDGTQQEAEAAAAGETQSKGDQQEFALRSSFWWVTSRCLTAVYCLAKGFWSGTTYW